MADNKIPNGGNKNNKRSFPSSTQTDQPLETTTTTTTTTTTIGQGDITTASLDALQSQEQQKLLNEIDKLRAYGISDFVSLPQLVVCGDQSSGKSSVLEAITEVPFPRKDNLCTRFATEIVLRRSSTKKVLVKILPANSRPEKEREELAKFGGTIEDFNQLPELTEAATAAMGISPTSSAFSRDVLSIEISGPNRPQLTIVDLPGLIHTENKSQTRADVELVSELCHTYISNPRTIILAVVTAKNDYANQIILKRARDADPDGNRTLGIITKPDTLPAGSESEGDFVGLAKNEDIVFRLGWHVMRNRGFENRTATFAERNAAEESFFNRGVWKDLPRDSVGVNSLRGRLSKLLLDHIRQELPKVFQEIKTKLQDTQKELDKLGERRSTPEEQRLFLSRLSQVFYGLCKAAIDGLYDDRFFGDALSPDGCEKRLRAIIQNRNLAFSKTMKTKGHRMQITDKDTASPVPATLIPASSTPGSSTPASPIPASPIPASPNTSRPPTPRPSKLTPQNISRTDALDWVQTVLARSRGRELPGTFNPLLIGELFWDQSSKWERLAQRHITTIWEACQTFIRRTLRELTHPDVFAALFTFHIDKLMDRRLNDAKKELHQILDDRRRHAMTYNHHYTNQVQKAHEKRRQDACRDDILSNLGLTNQRLGPLVTLNRDTLLKAIASHSPYPHEADMDTYACQEVLDCMSSYYKVALKTFIDNVASQVVERRIAGELWDIFSPVSIIEMDAQTVLDIAAESPEVKSKRIMLELQISRLGKGLSACRNALAGFKSSAKLPGSEYEVKARDVGGERWTRITGAEEDEDEDEDYDE